jgi:hypothetical protein
MEARSNELPKIDRATTAFQRQFDQQQSKQNVKSKSGDWITKDWRDIR